MKKQSPIIFRAMQLVFWIIAVGYAIIAGSILTSFVVSLFVNDIAARDLYKGLDLSAVNQYNHMLYIVLVSFLIVLTALKSYLAFLAIQIVRKVNIDKPFSEVVAGSIGKVANIALTTGLISVVPVIVCNWLSKKGIDVPVSWGTEETLFLAGIIFIVSKVFNKGIELQSEQELTV